MRPRHSLIKRIPIAAVLVMLAAQSLHAQTERSGGGANAQLYADYQQAVSERSQLQADNAKLKSDLADVEKQLAAAKQQLATTRSGSANSQAQLAAAQAAQANSAKSLATLKSQTDELIGRFRETVNQLSTVEMDRNQLRQQLQESKASYDKCAVANEGLLQVNDEVLDRYSHQGAFSYFGRAEPFTRLERIRIDNLALEYHQRAEQLRVERAAQGGATSPANGTASAAPPRAPDTVKR
jgi:chromosome segregation ATPase